MMLPVASVNCTDPEKESGVQERLLEAAGEVFAEKGIHGATIREITTRAGVNIAAVNYYFRDKEELYTAVLRHVHRCSLKDVWESLAEEAAENRLRRFIYGLLKHLLDPSHPKWHSLLMIRELAVPTQMLNQLVDEGLRPRCVLIMDAIQEVADVPLPQKKLQMIAASILGQCFFYRNSRAVAERLFPELYEGGAEEIAEHISNLSLSAIRMETASHPTNSPILE